MHSRLERLMKDIEYEEDLLLTDNVLNFSNELGVSRNNEVNKTLDTY